MIETWKGALSTVYVLNCLSVGEK